MELLPQSARSGGHGILYAVGIGVFGGSTQFIIKWLIDLTGNPVAPAWHLVGALGLRQNGSRIKRLAIVGAE